MVVCLGGKGSVAPRNWSRVASGLLLAISATLDARPEAVESTTLRPGVTVAEATREVLAQLRATHPEPLADAVYEEALRRSAATARTSVRELAAVLVLALDLRASVGAAIDVDPYVSGAVARELAMRVPMPRRRIVATHTLVAVDDGWRIGRGPELEGTAASLVLFLAGRGGAHAS